MKKQTYVPRNSHEKTHKKEPRKKTFTEHDDRSYSGAYPSMGEKLHSELDKSTRVLIEKIVKLQKLGVLKDCFSHEAKWSVDGTSWSMESTNRFEILEFYGDAVLQLRISKFLMQTRSFCSPHLLSKMRQEIVCNRALSMVWESLCLYNLGRSKIDLNVVLAMKQKADIIEALIGELAENSERKTLSSEGVFDLCTESLDEIIAYICYVGEARYFSRIDSTEFIDDDEIEEKTCSLCLELGHYASDCKKSVKMPVVKVDEKVVPIVETPKKKEILEEKTPGKVDFVQDMLFKTPPRGQSSSENGKSDVKAQSEKKVEKSGSIDELFFNSPIKSQNIDVKMNGSTSEKKLDEDEMFFYDMNGKSRNTPGDTVKPAKHKVSRQKIDEIMSLVIDKAHSRQKTPEPFEMGTYDDNLLTYPTKMDKTKK